eukprot:COSAG04_NODE_29_length_36122_cov_73.422619_12_plen_257_part_00
MEGPLPPTQQGNNRGAPHPIICPASTDSQAPLVPLRLPFAFFARSPRAARPTPQQGAALHTWMAPAPRPRQPRGRAGGVVGDSGAAVKIRATWAAMATAAAATATSVAAAAHAAAAGARGARGGARGRAEGGADGAEPDGIRLPACRRRAALHASWRARQRGERHRGEICGRGGGTHGGRGSACIGGGRAYSYSRSCSCACRCCASTGGGYRCGRCGPRARRCAAGRRRQRGARRWGEGGPAGRRRPCARRGEGGC